MFSFAAARAPRSGADTNAAVIIRARSGAILCVVLRNGRIALPGGGRHHGESNWQAMVREYEEETGIRFPLRDVVEVSSRPHVRRHGNGSTTAIFHGQIRANANWSYNRDGLLQRPSETTGLIWLTYDEMMADRRVEGYVKKSLDEMRTLGLV